MGRKGIRYSLKAMLRRPMTAKATAHAAVRQATSASARRPHFSSKSIKCDNVLVFQSLRTLFRGVGIGAEQFHERAVLAQFLESIGDFVILAMAAEIDVEDVFPVLLFRGARLDFRHVDFELVEGLQGADEGTGFVLDGEKNGSAVVAGGRAGFFADDEEAGGIGGAILDRGIEDGEAMKLGCEGSTECGGTMIGVFIGKLGGLGGRGNFDHVGIGEIFQNPVTALAEDLRVRVEGFDFFAWDGGHQVVFDAEQNLRADVERGIDEEIERVRDGTLGGVLDGDHAVVGASARDLIEDIGEVRLRRIMNRVAEFFDGGLMSPSALGAEVGDFEIVFEGESGGHDFAVDGADGFSGRRPWFFSRSFFSKASSRSGA
jgi:hypothetical protein